MVEQAEAKYLQPIEKPDYEKDSRRCLFGIKKLDILLAKFYTLVPSGRAGLVIYEDQAYADLLMPNGKVRTIQRSQFNYVTSKINEKERWYKTIRGSLGFERLMGKMVTEKLEHINL